MRLRTRRLAKLYWLRFLRASERSGKIRAARRLNRLGWDYDSIKTHCDK